MGVRRLEKSARKALDRLTEQVGAAGLSAAAVVPGLTAAIDQHAAAVRDILMLGVESGATVAGTVLLAGYARGVLDHLRDSGRTLRVPSELTDWLTADWVSVRLVAVCALARNLRAGCSLGAPGMTPLPPPLT